MKKGWPNQVLQGNRMLVELSIDKSLKLEILQKLNYKIFINIGFVPKKLPM